MKNPFRAVKMMMDIKEALQLTTHMEEVSIQIPEDGNMSEQGEQYFEINAEALDNIECLILRELSRLDDSNDLGNLSGIANELINAWHIRENKCIEYNRKALAMVDSPEHEAYRDAIADYMSLWSAFTLAFDHEYYENLYLKRNNNT